MRNDDANEILLEKPSKAAPQIQAAHDGIQHLLEKLNEFVESIKKLKKNVFYSVKQIQKSNPRIEVLNEDYVKVKTTLNEFKQNITNTVTKKN